MYFKKIIGDKVYLSPRSLDDIEKYTEWLNDYEIAKYVNQNRNVINIDIEKAYLEKTNNDYNFAIVDKESDKLIGSIGLMDIKQVDRTAELGIFIGDKEYLSKGYGSDAIKILLDYGFNQLNLNNIKLCVLDFNKRAMRNISLAIIKWVFIKRHLHGPCRKSVYNKGKSQSAGKSKSKTDNQTDSGS